jgi:hypothetical protein
MLHSSPGKAEGPLRRISLTLILDKPAAFLDQEENKAAVCPRKKKEQHVPGMLAIIQ